MFPFSCLLFLSNFFFTGFCDGNINAATNKLYLNVHNIDKKIADNNEDDNIHVQEEIKKPTYNIFEKQDNLHPLLKAKTDEKKNKLKTRREGDYLDDANMPNMQLELSDVSNEENNQERLYKAETLPTKGYMREETYFTATTGYKYLREATHSTAIYLARDENINNNLRQNKYKHDAQNGKNAMKFDESNDNDNDYGQSETIRTSRIRNDGPKNSLRYGNPAADINNNPSEEPNGENLRQNKYKHDAQNGKNAITFDESNENDYGQSETIRISRLRNVGPKNSLRYENPAADINNNPSEEPNGENLRQNKYKNDAQNGKNAMTFDENNENDYGQSETIRTSRIRNVEPKNSLRYENPVAEINNNPSDEPKADNLRQNKYKHDAQNEKNAMTFDESNENDYGQSKTIRISRLTNFGPKNSLRYVNPAAEINKNPSEEPNGENLRQNKYKHDSKNGKNAMTFVESNENDYGQSETIRTSRIRNVGPKNSLRHENPAAEINNNPSTEPKAENSGPVYHKPVIKFESTIGITEVTVKQPATQPKAQYKPTAGIKTKNAKNYFDTIARETTNLIEKNEPATKQKAQNRPTAGTKAKNTNNDFETIARETTNLIEKNERVQQRRDTTNLIEQNERLQQRRDEVQKALRQHLNSSNNLVKPIKLKQIDQFLEEHPEPTHRILIKDANQVDMAHASGNLLNQLRNKNKLCQRSVLQVEGPKYNHRGKIHVEEFVPRSKEKFYVTGRPDYLLPKCCNCCKKSVLGCQ